MIKASSSLSNPTESSTTYKTRLAVFIDFFVISIPCNSMLSEVFLRPAVSIIVILFLARTTS